jgi:hypothetical protein
VKSGESSARAALDPAFYLEVFGNLTITPDRRTVVTDNRATFSIALALPPSAGGQRVRFLSSEEQMGFAVRWRARLGTLEFGTTDPVAVYKAPHRIGRALVHTNLDATIRVTGVDLDLKYVVHADVSVVRRDWRIETEVVVDQPCLFFYKVRYFWNEQGTFFIDSDFKLRKNSAAIAQTSDPSTIWSICSVGVPHGYTAAKPTGDFEVDVQFETLNVSFFDKDAEALVLYGFSAFKGGSATLTGQGASPYVAQVGSFSLSFDMNVNIFEEGVWFDGLKSPGVTTHRHRIFSVDTP